MKHTPPPQNAKPTPSVGENGKQFEPDELLYAQRDGCKVDHCKGKHFSRGWCQAHYRRWTRYGHPLARRIDGETIIDRRKRK